MIPSLSIDPLDILLLSPDLYERRNAYEAIIHDPEPYFRRITDGLKDWRTIEEKNGGPALDKLIYLACFLKKDEFVGPLVSIAGDKDYQNRFCIYACPAELGLVVYTLSKPWQSDGQPVIRSLPIILGMEGLLRRLTLSRELPGIDFASPEDREALKKAEAMSEDELIKQASPTNGNLLHRWIAVAVLAGMIDTDKNICEFYWLALEEIGQRDFEYRESLYGVILRAELARSRRTGL